MTLHPMGKFANVQTLSTRSNSAVKVVYGGVPRVFPLSHMFLIAFTAVKAGVPNLGTDLFTNLNKLCPSCDT